jgi:hypothetical protein
MPSREDRDYGVVVYLGLELDKSDLKSWRHHFVQGCIRSTVEFKRR